MVDYNLESSPLEVKTNSEPASTDQTKVSFYTAEESYIGEIRIKLESTPQYRITNCMSESKNFKSTLPTAADKIWRITVTKSTDVRVQIHCNEVEVFNEVMSDEKCSEDEWRNRWTIDMDIEKIKFLPRDTASDYYRPYKGS